MAETIFERLGGFSEVRKIISDFYERVLDEEDLAGYFDHVDMRWLIDHQSKFVIQLVGGPAEFSDEVLHRIHRPLGITSDHFQLLAGILRETLEDHGLDGDDVTTIMAEVTRREPIVVTQYG